MSVDAGVVEQFTEWRAAENVDAIGDALFGVRFTPGQALLAGHVAFLRHKRLTATCHTRFGKTFSVGKGLAVLTVFDPRPLKIAVVAPQKEQAMLIRNEYVDAILRSPVTMRLLGLERKGKDRIERELSRSRLKFRDGKQLRILTAERDGKGIMGEGADVVVVEEAGLVGEKAWPKIVRMLGDDPDESVLIEVGNPWERGTQFERDCNDPNFTHVTLDWRRGVREGRITKQFVDEMRKRMTTSEFQILYDGVFPDSAEDQLLSWQWIDQAAEREPWTDFPTKPAVTWGLDVASGGVDFTVLTKATQWAGRTMAEQCDEWKWDQADTMATADKVNRVVPPASKIRVDSIGVGKGVGDRLRQLGHRVEEVNVGTSPRDERFAKLKGQLFWELREIHEQARIQYARYQPLLTDLTRYRFETRNGKLVTFESDGKSPDHGDSLMLAVTGASPGTTTIVQKGESRVPKRYAPGDLPGVSTP